MGRKKGSKNKKSKKTNQLKIVKKDKEEIVSKPAKSGRSIDEIMKINVKKEKIKLNDIYKLNESFYFMNKISSFISRWKPGQEKFFIDENIYIILKKFPTEKQYYDIICSKFDNKLTITKE